MLMKKQHSENVYPSYISPATFNFDSKRKSGDKKLSTVVFIMISILFLQIHSLSVEKGFFNDSKKSVIVLIVSFTLYVLPLKAIFPKGS